MNHSMWCSCRNMFLTGCVLSNREIPRDLQKGSILLGSHKSNAYAIHPGSINLKNMENVDLHLENASVLRLTCKICGQSINVLVRDNCTYAVLHKHPIVPNSDDPDCQPVELDSEEIQTFAPYIGIEEMDSDDPIGPSSCPNDEIRIEDDCDFVGDGDFEYMFSGTKDPFIGSFTDRFVSTPSAPLVF